MLAVSVDSLESAINAINGGADEIEICSALNIGGLTPSLGLVHEIQYLVKKRPVTRRPKLNAIIQCRSGNDFIYSDLEMQVMLRDLQIFKEMGIEKFVFGALNDNRDIDETKCMAVLTAASPNKVTFGRAFDHLREIKRSAAILCGIGFHRILTSGQKPSVNHPGAGQMISYLATRYKEEDLVIMPGGGVTAENVGTFINMGCEIVHSSCCSTYQLPIVEMPHQIGENNSNYVYITDYDIVRQMKAAIAAEVDRMREGEAG